MLYIDVREIRKTYRTAKKREGAAGSLAGLFKREYEYIRAIDGISFSIGRGELVAYIGPNGAGKSTTVKILTGILNPDGGDVTIDGRCPWRERKSHVAGIGVVFGQRTQLWWDVPVIDSFTLLRDIYSIKQADYKLRLDELTGSIGITELLDKPLRQLSLGQRMRCELAASLLHRPQLLFLDEPTIGLDAISKLAVREFLKNEHEKYGTTVILTTHDTDDIAALCKRVMVIGKGRLLYDDTLAGLVEKYEKTRFARIRYADGDVKPPDFLPCKIISGDAAGYLLEYDPKKVGAGALLTQLQNAGEVADIELLAKPIDSVIAQMYSEMSI